MHFKQSAFKKAIICYTKSIKHDETSPLPYLNRALAYIKHTPPQYQLAINDCSACISLDKTNVKAHLRRGLAKKEVGSTKEALDDFKIACVLDPTNSVALSEIKQCEMLLGINIKETKSNNDSNGAVKSTRRKLVVKEIGKKSDYVSMKDLDLKSRMPNEIILPGQESGETKVELLKEVSSKIIYKEYIDKNESEVDDIVLNDPIIEIESFEKDNVPVTIASKMKLPLFKKPMLPTKIPLTMFDFDRDWKSLSKDLSTLYTYIKVGLDIKLNYNSR